MKVFYASTRNGVRKAVRDILDEMNWKSLLPAGSDILVKLNLTQDHIRPGVDTSPWVVEAFAEKVSGHVGHMYPGKAETLLKRLRGLAENYTIKSYSH